VVDETVVVHMAAGIAEKIVQASHVILLGLLVAEPGWGDLRLIANAADFKARDIETMFEERGSGAAMVL
jgi:hypothetical protein